MKLQGFLRFIFLVSGLLIFPCLRASSYCESFMSDNASSCDEDSSFYYDESSSDIGIENDFENALCLDPSLYKKYDFSLKEAVDFLFVRSGFPRELISCNLKDDWNKIDSSVSLGILLK